MYSSLIGCLGMSDFGWLLNVPKLVSLILHNVQDVEDSLPAMCRLTQVYLIMIGWHKTILISDWLISCNMLMFLNALSLEDSSSNQQNFLTGKYLLLIGWYRNLLISDWLTAWSELFQTWGHWIFLGQILAGFQRTESQVCISNPDWLILVHTWFWLVDAN